MFLLGRKIGMSQVFSEDGKVTPVTIVEAGPIIIVQVKTKDKDGYNAVQFGYGENKKIKKPQSGHSGKLGNFRVFKELKTDDVKIGTGEQEKEIKKGEVIDTGIFNIGDAIKVRGLSKAKGFQGVVKRHGFHGAPASHGHKSMLRRPGSIGQRFPQHTLPGMRMAGRMGGVNITVRGLKVMAIDKAKNLMAIKGAVPGRRGTLLEISKM
ncbi:MAG: 50S ribosomal protein L3 [bacterium]|nr:50S ribosomal protein L3 [bacterium]